MSEIFDKSQMSEMIDVPAGCIRVNLTMITKPDDVAWRYIVSNEFPGRISNFMMSE